MKFLEELDRTGRIPRYRLEEDIESLCLTYNKPSARVLHTKIGLKTLALLKRINIENNHSWYEEIRLRSSKHMNKTAIFYRGNKITYKEMLEKADVYAKALLAAGVEKGDEIPACISNTPELVYLMLGANRIGAKLNLFGTNLDPDFMHEIVNGCCKKIAFVSDDNYFKIKDTLSDIKFDKKVVISLQDSLPEHPELCDEYEPELDKYYHYDSYVDKIKNIEPVFGIKEFEDFSKNYNGIIIDDNDLDTEFTVTYSSGSTFSGFPKRIVHCNRSYIVGGIYNDSNLTGSPDVPEIRGLAHIHPDSNTNLVTCISDNLIKGGSVAMEPEYSRISALDVLFLNKPVHYDATTSFLVEAAKQYLIERRFHKNGKGRKLPQMLVAMAVGEKCDPGEEKFINRFMREASAGSSIKLNGLRLPFAPMSMGGGDCEHGGIYYTLLKQIQRLAKFPSLGKKEYGLTPVPFAVVTALKQNENGEYEECDYGEYGIIVANSITNMAGYDKEPGKTKSKIIRDKYGRDWLNCDIYGYINKIGNVVLKGRTTINIITDQGDIIPTFAIDDVVCLDTKNILSCTTVGVPGENGDIPVVNIELSPFKISNRNKIMKSLRERCREKLPNYISENMVIRIVDSKESFALTGSGKRDVNQLKEMGIKNTFEIDDYGNLLQINHKEDVKKKILK